MPPMIAATGKEESAAAAGTHQRVSLSSAGARQIVTLLTKTSAVYLFANFGTRALNFVFLPLYTRFLTPADYGIVSLSEIVAAIWIALTSLGTDAALSRLYFQRANDSPEQRDYVCSLLRFALLLVLGTALLAILAGAPVEHWIASRSSIPFFPYIAFALAAAAATHVLQYALTLSQLRMQSWRYARLAVATWGVTTA